MSLDLKYRELLREVPLFKDLDESNFLQVIEGTTPCTLINGESLFRQHQTASDFFFVVKGKIKISLLSIDGTEKVVDIIREGNTFAEAIIFRGMNGYPVNADALVDSIVLRINAAKYIEVLSHSTEACFQVIGNLSTRTHWLMNEVERLSLHNATYRLISYLLETVPEETSEAAEVNLSIAKHVVASRISVTPETLSRTLKRLSQQGLLEVRDNYVILLKPAELRRMVSI